MGLPLLRREMVVPRRPPNLAVLEAKLEDLRLFEALLRRDVVATLDTSSNACNQKAWSLILLLLLLINRF